MNPSRRYVGSTPSSLGHMSRTGSRTGLNSRSGFRDPLAASEGVIYRVFILESSVYYWCWRIARSEWNPRSRASVLDGGKPVIARWKHDGEDWRELVGHAAGCNLDSDTLNGSGEVVQKVGCAVAVCWDADVQVWSAQGRV